MSSLAAAMWVAVALGQSEAAEGMPRFKPTVESLTVRNGQVELTVLLHPEKVPPKPVYVGLSFGLPRSDLIWDVPHRMVPPKDTGKPVTLKGPLPPGRTRYTVCVWAQENDSGLLEGSLGGIPEGTFAYDDAASWTPFVDVPVRVKVLDAGGGAAAVKQVAEALEASIAKRGHKVKVTQGGKAQAQRAGTEVLVRDAAHWALAEGVALPAGATLKGWPESPESIVVAVGK